MQVKRLDLLGIYKGEKALGKRLNKRAFEKSNKSDKFVGGGGDSVLQMICEK